MSASETRLPPLWASLNEVWMPSRTDSVFLSRAGSLTSQSFWGERRMRAPFAPPRLSDPRKVEAEAQAVVTRSEDRQPGDEKLLLQNRDVAGVDQRVVDRRKRVLPDQGPRRALPGRR